MPDFPDFAQTVAALDVATPLAAQPAALHNGQQLANLDTSQLASLTILIGLPAGGATSKYFLTVTWHEAGNPAAYDFISYHCSPAYGGRIAFISWELPVRGQDFTIALAGDDAQDSSLYIVGSTRAIPGPRIAHAAQRMGALLLNTGVLNVAAGATSAVMCLPPVTRALRVVSGYAITDIVVNLDAVSLDAFAPAAVRTWRAQQATSPQVWDDVLMPSTASELTIVNNGGVAHSSSLQVSDVS